MTLYTAGVRLYPRRFREEYGDDLVALADQMRLDLGRRRAALRLASDLLVSLPARHLEVLMKRPSPLLVPVALALIALVFVTMAAVLGSAAGVGMLVVAILAAAVAALAFPKARIVREPSITGHWWQLILAGLLLHGGLLAGQALTDSDASVLWLLAFAAVLSGWLCIGAGLVLALAHLLRRRPATG